MKYKLDNSKDDTHMYTSTLVICIPYLCSNPHGYYNNILYASHYASSI